MFFPGNPITVWVKTDEDNYDGIQTYEHDTVLNLKYKIEQRFSIPPDQQYLYYGRTFYLDDSRTLNFYGIQRGLQFFVFSLQ